MPLAHAADMEGEASLQIAAHWTYLVRKKLNGELFRGGVMKRLAALGTAFLTPSARGVFTRVESSGSDVHESRQF